MYKQSVEISKLVQIQKKEQFDYQIKVIMNNQIPEEFQSLSNLAVAMPCLWLVVKPQYILREYKISLQDLRDIDAMLSFGQESLSQTQKDKYAQIYSVYCYNYNYYFGQQQMMEAQMMQQNHGHRGKNYYYGGQQNYSYAQGQTPYQQSYAQQSNYSPVYPQEQLKQFYAQQQHGYDLQNYSQNQQNYSQENNLHEQQGYSQQRHSYNHQNDPQKSYSHHHDHRHHGNNKRHEGKPRYKPKESQEQSIETKETKQNQQNTDSQIIQPQRQIQTPSTLKSETSSKSVNIEKTKESRINRFSINQIKEMVKQADTEELKKKIDPRVIQQVNSIKSWKKSEKYIQFKPQIPQKVYKRQSNMRKSEAETAALIMGTKIKQKELKQQFVLFVGKNETMETRKKKLELKEKATVNYAKQKEKQAESLSENKKAQKEILFIINKIAPENLKDVRKSLNTFVISSEDTCRIVIDVLTQKAWQEPKYAASYAKVCQIFSKDYELQYKFKVDQKDFKNTPFKHLLVEKVQQSFLEKKKISEDETKQNFLRDAKKKVIGNVKFIAELIKAKVLQKVIIRICLQNLMTNFLHEHYLFEKTGRFEHSFYDYHFEALIEFLEALGDRTETLDEQKKETERNRVNYVEAQKWVQEYCFAKQEKAVKGGLFTSLKIDEFFKLFRIIDEHILKKKHNRLSALLMNLEERRRNGWKTHHVQAEVAKKLKEINAEEMKPEEKQRLLQQALEKDMVKLLKGYQENSKTYQKDFVNLRKKNGMEDVISLYFRVVAEEKKENVRKRLDLLEYFLDNDYFDQKTYKNGWTNAIKYLAFMEADIPFCGAALALCLKTIKMRKEIELQKFFINFDPDEEEDEFYFMEGVFQKLHYYLKQDLVEEEEIKKFVEIPKRYSHLL